ncbi:integrase core domain-containing protein [Myxococcus virescens]|uniref:integrase core domain-containing protein n=1 Tax=Myxococcus virescens TaxID=83456 RepID=UPI003DA5C65B
MTLEAWGRHYNTRRPHQALDWKTPAEVRAEKLASPPARGHIAAPHRHAALTRRFPPARVP